MLLYLLAAGATLAGASVAQAKVVFTPSNVVLKPRSGLSIDLNNDGVVDFSLVDFASTISVTCTSKRQRRMRRAPDSGECREPFNFIEVSAPDDQGEEVMSSGLAAALGAGAKIGGDDTFDQPNEGLGLVSGVDGGVSYGNFNNVTNRFIGVRFRVNGQTHFGWIGFRSVKGFVATLAGWAYETEPNKAIVAGDRGESEDLAEMKAAQPTGLELLAMGHVAVAERQRRTAAHVNS
jgi:hypothetical protein